MAVTFFFFCKSFAAVLRSLFQFSFMRTYKVKHFKQAINRYILGELTAVLV